MKRGIAFTSFLRDPMLLGAAFDGGTWAGWEALVPGALAQPMTAAGATTFRDLTQRDPPSEPVRELWVIAGRRAGKSRVAAALACYLATCRDWSAAPGEVPTVLVLAADREQAQVAFRYVRGLLHASPLLAQEIASESRERITLQSGVEIQVSTSDYRAVRGRSLVAAICDEIAFWEPSPESVNPDSEVLAAIRPALATFPGSLLVCISSPYAQKGALYEAFRRYYGQSDPRVLVARAPTRLLNPSLPESLVAEELERDPEAARAEWLAEFRSDMAALIDGELLNACTRSEPRELPPLRFTKDGTPIRYLAGLDVSGGRSDATACAIAHRDGPKVVLDAVRRWPAPHDPVEVAKGVAEFLAGYGLATATSDQYGAELARSIYAEMGVGLADAEANRSEAYLNLLPLMTSGRVELPPDPRLRVELLGLERRTARGGRDSVDHRSGAHDDLANATALVAWVAARAGDSCEGIFVVYSQLTLNANDQGFLTMGADFEDWP